MENIFVEESEMSEYSQQLIEDALNGRDAGETFAQRHIIEKINLFIDEYRRNGYSEEYVQGFIDGVNEMTGDSISLEASDGEGVSDELEEAGTSVQEMQEAG